MTGPSQSELWSSPMCDCGHDSRQHVMSLSPFTPRYCLIRDCDCSSFRPVGGDDDREAGEAA